MDAIGACCARDAILSCSVGPLFSSLVLEALRKVRAQGESARGDAPWKRVEKRGIRKSGSFRAGFDEFLVRQHKLTTFSKKTIFLSFSFRVLLIVCVTHTPLACGGQEEEQQRGSLPSHHIISTTISVQMRRERGARRCCPRHSSSRRR